MSPKHKPSRSKSPAPDHSPTAPTAQLRAVGYCRVSSQDQLDGTSLEDQVKRISGYAASKNINLIHTYTEAETSRTTFAVRAQRTGLAREIERGTIKAVIVYKLDRAFRDTVDCLQTVDEWEDLGIALHIVNLGGNSIDVTTPSGRFMLTVLAAAAEMERETIRERCETGREVRRQQGKRIGEIPFGYDLDPHNNDLIPNASEQLVIQQIRDLRAEGMGTTRIATLLRKQSVPTKKGGQWTAQTVQKIIDRTRISNSKFDANSPLDKANRSENGVESTDPAT